MSLDNGRMTRSNGMTNNLGTLREQRGISVARLAAMVGVARQSVYAMEAGSFVPNTEVALKLARVLECHVEDLFCLNEDPPPPAIRTETASLLPGSEDVLPGQSVQLSRVGEQLVATPPAPMSWYFPPSDATVARPPAKSGALRVNVTDNDREFGKRVLVAGCDPGISVLARSAQLAGVELILVHRNSSQALQLLKKGRIHIAGTHLRDEATGDNMPGIDAVLSKDSVAVISFAVWEEGIVAAIGNPKNIRAVEDLARRDVSIVNREEGAGARKLLDSQLKSHGIGSRSVRGYQNLALGHVAAAWQVRSGAVDCCIAPGAVARLLGLSFTPLVTERYDLALRRQDLDNPGIRVLLETLNRSRFRHELESYGGYDARDAGRRLL
jgi:putative molybdopterin biosynthesis protein